MRSESVLSFFSIFLEPGQPSPKSKRPDLGGGAEGGSKRGCSALFCMVPVYILGWRWLEAIAIRNKEQRTGRSIAWDSIRKPVKIRQDAVRQKTQVRTVVEQSEKWPQGGLWWP